MNIDENHLHCFVTPVDQADVTACSQVLSGRELEKARAFRFDKDRRLSITARAQVRWLLSGYTGETPEKIRFLVEEKGKPRVCPGTPGENIGFNVSHSKGLVVSVFGRGLDVGVDVEGLGRDADPDIARRFFTGAEACQIMALAEPERRALFLRFWTLKEAWAKAGGQGLGAGLDQIGFDLSSPDAIGYTTAHAVDAGCWRFFQFHPAHGAVAAVAAASNHPLSLSVYHCLPFGDIRLATVKVIASA